MRVAEHADALREQIRRTPFLVTHNLAYEARTPYAGLVYGSAIFADGSTLHFREYLHGQETLERLKYSYHYAYGAQMIFRFDNAWDPAARDLPTYPHHLHTPEGIQASHAPTLSEVLQMIAQRLSARPKGQGT